MRSRANGPGALLGYRATGTALRNYNPSTGGFGATVAGPNPVLDAATAGGWFYADVFVTVSPTAGVEFYEFDPATDLYGVTPEILPPSHFPAGQLVSSYLPTPDAPVLALSRLTDAGTTSKLSVHQRAGGPATPLSTFNDAQARQLKCITLAALTQGCGATFAGGTARLFAFDPASPTAVPTVHTLPTGAGSLGIDVARRTNGNLVFVAANFTANSINVIETSPDLTAIVGNTSIPAPAGCTNPAYPAMFTDGEGLKAAITCNSSDSYWVKLIP